MADPNIPPPPPGFTLDAPSATPSPFGTHPVIQGPPPAPKTTYRMLTPQEVQQQHLPAGSYQMSSEGQITKVADADSNAQSTQKQQAMEATKELLGSIEKARGYVNGAYNTPVGNTATGGFYNVLKHSPVPNEATALDSTIQGEIQGNIFKNWMSSMKAATEQGGSAFGGRIMQSEIPFIVNSLGALKPGSLTTQQFLGNLDQVEQRAVRSAAMLNGENPDDPKVMQKYQQMLLPPQHKDNTQPAAALPGATQPPSGGGGTTPGGGGGLPSQLSPEQQAADRAMLAANPTPQQYAAFLSHLLNTQVDPKAAALRLSAAQAGGTYSGDVKPEQGLGHDFAVGLGGVAQGVGDIAGLVSNPFIQLYDAATGSNVRPDMGANLRDFLGLPAPQNDQESLINRINDYGTQALGFASGAKALASHVPGIIGSALEAFGNHPLTDSASGATGGASGEVARQSGAGPIGQMAATVAGGLPAAAIGTSATNALMRDSAAVPGVVNAGKQEGVTVNRAMAYPQLTPQVIATGKTMTGAKVMANDMKTVGNQIQGRVQALKDGGSALEPYNVGDTAQNIGKRYIQQSGQDFQQQYGALRAASGGVQIPANQSLSDVDALIERLSKAPASNAKEISYLQGIRSDLARGLDVESARDIGSKLSADIRKGDVTFGKSEADVLGIKKSISADIANGLQSAGLNGVAKQFKAVDSAYQQRMDFIQNTIQKLTGRRDAPLPPEQAAARIQAWAGKKGDSASLGRIMAQATPEERADIGATFLEALGKNTGEIAKNISNMPTRTKTILFGEDGAKSLNNIQQLAAEHARVMRSLGGSPTALAGDARSWLLRVMFGGGSALADLAAGGGSLGSAATAVGTTAALTGAKMGGDLLSARALMSPKITGWLRSAPKSADPKAINAWVDRLKVIAVREPALAPEVQRIQDGLSRAANSNITPAAAASGTQEQGYNQ